MTVLITTFMTACAGMKPKPVYTTNEKNSPREESSPGSELKPPSPSKLDFHREGIMQEIENLLGVPYRYGGTSRSGMDCSGFVQYIFNESVSYALPRQVEDMYQLGEPVSMNNLQFGDLVFFSKIEHAGLSHVGLYLDSNQFAHASVSQGVIFSRMDEPYYARRYVGAKRLRIE